MKRGHVFYARVWVPLDVRHVVQRNELKKSLQTGKRSEARVLATGLQHKAETAFMRIRTGMFTDRELERLACELIATFTGKMEDHKSQRKDVLEWTFSDVESLFPSVDLGMINTTLTTPKKPTDVARLVDWYNTNIENLQSEIATEFYSRATRNTARRVASAKQLSIPFPPEGWFRDPEYNPPSFHNSYEGDDDLHGLEESVLPTAEEIAEWEQPAPPEFNQLCNMVLNAQIDAYTVSLERAQGKNNTTFQHRITERIESAKKALTLSELWESYRDTKVTLGDWGGDGRTEAGYTAKFKEAVDILGDRELSHYDNDSALTFIKALQKKNKPGTIIIKTEFLSSLFKWAIKEKGHNANPFADKQVADDVDVEDKKKPYTTEDLHSILTGLLTVRKLVEPHRFWVPLVALYSGMRQGEICQLRLEDIMVEDGIPVFNIRHRPEYKQLVKKRDIRTCPIHPTLVRLGFLEYVDTMRMKGHERLFPTLTYSTGKGWAGKIRTWYNETFQTKWVADTDKKSFHSLRGTLINQFKQDMLYDRASDRSVVQSMIGHEGDGSTTSKHYEDKFPVSTKYKMLKKLNFKIDPDLIEKLRAKEL